MYFSIILSLFLFNYISDKCVFSVPAEDAKVVSILEGEEIIEGLTKYFSNVAVKNSKTPFKILVLDGREIQPNTMLEHLGADKVHVPSKQKFNAFWEKFMSYHGLSEATKNSLILPGQPGMLLAMVFQQTMCEAFSLAQNLKNLSPNDEKRNFNLLRHIYQNNIQFIDPKKIIVNYPTPTMCFSGEVFFLIDAVSRKTVNMIGGAIRTHGRSFILNDCFDEQMQPLVQDYLQTLKTSKSACSQRLTRDFHFSFDFINTAEGLMNKKVEIMKNLIQSAKIYRSKLAVVLKNHKKTKTNDLSKKSLDEELESVRELTKASSDMSSEDESPKTKKKASILQKIYLSPLEKKKKFNHGVEEGNKQSQNDMKIDSLHDKIDSSTEDSASSFDVSSIHSSASSLESNNPVSEHGSNEKIGISQSPETPRKKGVFERMRNYLTNRKEPKNDERITDTIIKHPQKSTFYYDIDSKQPENLVSEESSMPSTSDNLENKKTIEFPNEEEKESNSPISSRVQRVVKVSPHHKNLMKELQKYHLQKSKSLSG